MAGKPPPSGGGGGVCWCAGENSEPAALFGGLWGPLGNSQKWTEGGKMEVSWDTTNPKNPKA